MNSNPKSQFSEEHQKALESIKISRIIVPVLIGLGVVIYLLLKEFDPEEFNKIPWVVHTYFWIGSSIFFLILRHLAYAYRLRLLSDRGFSWIRCIQLIFIWEFSSAVSPTSVGGSAVAFFVLAQEKLSTAKTATIVLYTVVLDTLFFIAFLPLLIGFLGLGIIHPTMNGATALNSWGISFITFYGVMFSYGLLFYYGLFINPVQLKKLLVGFTKIRFFKKWRRAAVELGDNMILTSKELKSQKWHYHLKAFLSTTVAWSSKFLLLNCLIIAFVPDLSASIFNQLILYGRQNAMFVIIAFSPTPGGSGIIEYVFGGFLGDFIPGGISAVVNLIWRFLTYYAYLIAGVLIIPGWIQNVIKQRKLKRSNRYKS